MNEIGWPEGESPSALNDRARALMVDEAVRYSDSLTVRCQPALTAMIARAAKARSTRPAEYVRQTLLAGLRADGFDLAAMPARDAGTLYDVLNGRRRIGTGFRPAHHRCDG